MRDLPVIGAKCFDVAQEAVASQRIICAGRRSCTGRKVNLQVLRAIDLWRLLYIVFCEFSEGSMSVKAIMATILHNQLTSRGVHSLTPSDYEEIIEELVEQLKELELSLAAREVTDEQEP